MRSLQLQAALREFLAQAAARLHEEVLAGHEVPFELASQSGRGRGAASLYSYRPLTGAFIAERFSELRRLDAYARAAALLDEFQALDRYLIASGIEPGRSRDRPGRGRADAALLVLLQEVFDQQTDFDRTKIDRYEQRLEHALDRLEDSTFAAAGEVTLVATLHGLTIASPELAIARGLLIAHPDSLQGIPEQALSDSHDKRDHLLVVFNTRDADPRAAIAQGREVVRELLRALRLFGDGRIALGSLAWTRIGSGSWSPIALGASGHPHGMLVVSAEQEDELRAFCNLVSRRAPNATEIAWALHRFELGCERASELDGLSDHLLALRALLGPPSEFDPGGSPDGLLAARLAALCAVPEGRGVLAERTLRAIAIERQVIAGTAPRRMASVMLARELSDHLRALLRDVLCGHLPAHLGSLADELLLSGEEIGDEPVESNAGQATVSGKQVSRDRRESSEVLHVAV